MAGNNHSPKLTEIAQKLYTESGSYYSAAKRLGNPTLRAQLHRVLNEDSFRPSEDFVKSLWEWAEIKPLVIQAWPGSQMFGASEDGLVNINRVVAIVIMPPEEWKRHSMECAVCHEPCPRWSSTQKYCEKHSWQTPEGRRFQREKRAAL
jgi:hypothetical protein